MNWRLLPGAIAVTVLYILFVPPEWFQFHRIVAAASIAYFVWSIASMKEPPRD